jgi:RNA recognition motif-containing protein
MAFISIDGAQEAQKAMTVLNGKDFMGRKIRVNQARTMQDTGISGNGRRSF